MKELKKFRKKNKKIVKEKVKPASKLINVIVILVAIIFLSPIVICFLMAFKTPMETAENLFALPESLNFENFSKAIEVTNFFVSLKNSIIVTVGSVILIVFCSALSGYIITRNRHKIFYRLVELTMLAGMMIPFQIVLIPIYRIMHNLGLLNTRIGAIILICGCAVPYATFLYSGFVRTIPSELEEAAIIDGCNMYQMYWRIIFPLLKPITATVAALEMLWTWNEFNVSLIVLQSKEVRTIPMQQFYFFGQHVSNMNAAFAAATLSLIPVVVFFLMMQKYIAGGLTDGAVKG